MVVRGIPLLGLSRQRKLCIKDRAAGGEKGKQTRRSSPSAKKIFTEEGEKPETMVTHYERGRAVKKYALVERDARNTTIGRQAREEKKGERHEREQNAQEGRPKST